MADYYYIFQIILVIWVILGHDMDFWWSYNFVNIHNNNINLFTVHSSIYWTTMNYWTLFPSIWFLGLPQQHVLIKYVTQTYFDQSLTWSQSYQENLPLSHVIHPSANHDPFHHFCRTWKSHHPLSWTVHHHFLHRRNSLPSPSHLMNKAELGQHSLKTWIINHRVP